MEVHVFFYAVWTGVVVYLSYIPIILLRKIIKHNIVCISLEDFCYWLFISMYTYYHIFLATSGVLRWYFFVGIVVGVTCTHIIWYGVKKVGRKIVKSLAKVKTNP